MARYIAALILALSLAWPAKAQTVCMDHTRMQQRLFSEYGEVLVARGLAQVGGVIEIWRNPDTRSFSITMAHPSGLTCLVSVGGHFEFEPGLKGTAL